MSLNQVALLTHGDLLEQGPAGHRPPESDEQATDEATFAKRLAQRLNAAALNNEYDHLVLAADPQTLGQIRPQLHKGGRAANQHGGRQDVHQRTLGRHPGRRFPRDSAVAEAHDDLSRSERPVEPPTSLSAGLIDT